MTNQVCIYKLHVIISGQLGWSNFTRSLPCPNGFIYIVRMLKNQFHAQMAQHTVHMLRNQFHVQMALCVYSTHTKILAPCPNGSIYTEHMPRDHLFVEYAKPTSNYFGSSHY